MKTQLKMLACRKRRLLLAALIGFGLMLPGAAHAATFNVSDGDVAALKSAINASNANDQADTINLATGGTYTLSTRDNSTNGANGLPVVEDDLSGQDLTLNGNGATLQRNSAIGTPSFRLLQFGSEATITLSGLIVINGRAAGNDTSRNGGGIYNSSTLTINDCTFSGNRSLNAGGGILNVNGGIVTVNNCTFSDNRSNSGGGAIVNGSGCTLTVNDCTLSNNLAVSNGGGVSNGGVLTISNSILSGNRGDNGGGGIYSGSSGMLTVNNCTFSGNLSNGGVGGGIGLFSPLSPSLVSNSTFSGNTARIGGGIHTDGGLLTVTNSTFHGNSSDSDGGGLSNLGSYTITLINSTFSSNTAGNSGGGISNGGSATLEVKNILVANNSTSATGPDCHGSFTSQGYNLIGKSDGSSGIANGVNNDQVGTSDAPLDPKLDPTGLQDNGGPTQTIKLLPGSPALDKGKGFGIITDQRGQTRPIDNLTITNASGGDGSDIGALEVQSTLSVNDTRAFAEGSPASPTAPTFTVTLDFASTQIVTVGYSTTDDLAKAGSDYVAKSGNLTFLPGETSKRVTVSFIGDSVPEPSETFFFDLKTPVNAIIAQSRGVAFIRDDDGPSISIADAAPADEGNSAQGAPALTLQSFIVSLSSAATATVSVNWATAYGTAGPRDLVPTSGTLTFAPGQTSKLITVQIKGDTIVEPNETYHVNLSSPTFAVLADSQAIGTIVNDDAALIFENDEPSE